MLNTARSEGHSNTIYRELEWLYHELRKVSLKEKGTKEYIPLPPADIQRFLEHESMLTHMPAVVSTQSAATAPKTD